jgi:hypothetical protein
LKKGCDFQSTPRFIYCVRRVVVAGRRGAWEGTALAVKQTVRVLTLTVFCGQDGSGGPRLWLVKQAAQWWTGKGTAQQLPGFTPVCGITTRAALVTPGIFRPLLLLPVAIPPSLPCSKSLKTLHPVSALASGDPHPVGTHIILGCKLEPPRCPRCHVSRRGGSTLLQDAQKKSLQRPWNEVRTPHPSTARGKQTSPPDPDPLSLSFAD